MSTPNPPSYDAGLQEGKDDYLCLHRNENLFVGRDWTVDQAGAVAGEIGVQTYPDPNCTTLRRALADHYGLEPENVLVGNGSDEVLAILFSHFRERFDEVHCLDVCFKVYPMLAARYGFETATLGGDTFRTGRLAAEAFRGFAVVDSPNAISGVHIPEQDLAQLTADPEAVVIWDNVYGEYAGDEIRTPLPPNRIVVRSFSKFYGIAALRIGYCLADARLIEALNAKRDVFNVNGFAQAMAVAALARHQDFEAHCEAMLACRAAIVTGLSDRGFESHPPAGHFILTRHPSHDAETLQRGLMDRGVAVRRFPGGLTDPYIRITVPPMAGVETLLNALDSLIGAPPSQDGDR